MDSNTILYIHKDSKKEQSYEKALSDEYSVISWPITQKGLFRELPECTIILITVDDLSSSEYERLEDFLLIFPTTYIPTVLLGSKIFLKAFRSNVKYPAMTELDYMKADFNLKKSIKDIFKKINVENVKRESIKNSTDALLGIYSNAFDERNKYRNLFKNLCEVECYDSDEDYIYAVGHKPPDAILLSYSAAISDDYKLLKRTRGSSKAAETPIILFGPSISQFQFQDLLPFKPNGYLVNGSSDTDAISLLSSHLNRS